MSETINLPDLSAFGDMPELSDLMPAKTPIKDQLDKERVFRTGLSVRLYLLLEKESIQRSTKPYNLARSVLTLYLMRKLVLVHELPQSIQDQIAVHFKNTEQTLVI